jgi:predicted alpha/beta hydrolase family esterase
LVQIARWTSRSGWALTPDEEQGEIIVAPVIIVPGLGGSGKDHWQTHLQQSLAGAIRVDQDDWDRPELSSWLARLVACVESRPRSILVAHSIGCIVVAHLAARRSCLSVAAVVLVAPADVEACQDTLRSSGSFAPIPRRELPFHSVVVASTNDPFMGFDRALELARAWKAQFVNAGASGHINIASGHGRWHAGEEMVRRLEAEIDTADWFDEGLVARAG